MKVKKKQGSKNSKNMSLEGRLARFFERGDSPQEGRFPELATTYGLTDNSSIGGNQNGR